MAKRLWTPEQDLTSALVAHWDAQRNVALASRKVSTWADTVAGLTATASGNITYSATARNGTPGVIFDGSSQFPFTPSAGFPSGSAASAIYLAFHCPDNATHQALIIGDGNNTVRGFASRGVVSVGINGDVFNSTFSTANRDTAALWNQSRGTATIYTDGAGPQSGALAVDNNLSAGTIGRAPPINYVGENFTDVIQQILIFNRALTDAERQNFEGWESWHDGKAGANLPANHPYKAAAPTVTTADPVTARRRPLILMAS